MDGVRAGPLWIPEDELDERFSRSSGPGGQSVNTSDTRVELRWRPSESRAVPGSLADRLTAGLAGRLTGGALTVTVSEFRSQWRNRVVARQRMAAVLAEALRPPPPRRRPTRPSRSVREKRLADKRHRSAVKRARGRPAPED